MRSNMMIMRSVVLVALWLCNALAKAGNENIESILREPLRATAYAVVERCISKSRYRTIDVVDESVVMLSHGKDENYVWLSVLIERCRGLQRGQVIHLRKITPSVCAGDSFAGLQRGSTEDPRDMIQVSKDCGFGMMHRIDRQNLPDLLQAIESARKTRTVTETYRTFEQ